jgi:hypothetical protein
MLYGFDLEDLEDLRISSMYKHVHQCSTLLYALVRRYQRVVNSVTG